MIVVRGCERVGFPLWFCQLFCLKLVVFLPPKHKACSSSQSHCQMIIWSMPSESSSILAPYQPNAIVELGTKAHRWRIVEYRRAQTKHKLIVMVGVLPLAVACFQKSISFRMNAKIHGRKTSQWNFIIRLQKDQISTEQIGILTKNRIVLSETNIYSWIRGFLHLFWGASLDAVPRAAADTVQSAAISFTGTLISHVSVHLSSVWLFYVMLFYFSSLLGCRLRVS